MARRLGEYELLKKIGSGGMAEVWMGRRASVSGMTKAVAIKRLSVSLADDPRYQRMFMDEARLSMLLSHSNIVQVFDVGQEADASYIVMEWVDGLNLAQICHLLRQSQRDMPFDLTAYILGELLQALSYAHTLTHEGEPLYIVHRDVSPQNVLVSISGEVKLADFGVARFSREDTSGIHVKGKLRYMAPEHLAGQGKGPTVDLYAVGAILHEMLEGQKFRGDMDEVELYGQILQGVIPPLQREGIPRELVELREGLLQADPARRIPSADIALALLQRWSDYRNTSLELAKICRWFMGVQAPRSGIHNQVAEPSPQPFAGVPADGKGGTVMLGEGTTTSSSQASREYPNYYSPTPSGGFGGPPFPGNKTVMTGGEAEAKRTSRTPGLGLVLGGALGAIFLIAAIFGGVYLWRGSVVSFAAPQFKTVNASVRSGIAQIASRAKPHADVPVPSPVPEPVPTPSPGPVLPVDPKPQPGTDSNSGTGAAADSGTGGGSNTAKGTATTTPEPTPAVVDPNRPVVVPDNPPPPDPKKENEQSPPKPPPRVLVPVQFRLSGPRFAYVRIDYGRKLALEPTAKIKLMSGPHTIEWSSDGAVFKGGRKINFKPGGSYVIKVTASGIVQ